MVRAFSHPDPAVAHLVAGAMETAGIAAHVRSDGYGAALGELPPVAAWAEVWVADAARLGEAEAIASASMEDAPASGGAPWACACGEAHDGPFAACWRCGADRPAA